MNKQTITFTASEQTLTKTGGIEHYASNIVSYIEASFTLGDNWAGYDSIRAVWESGYARIATVLDANNKCIVPTEVLTYKSKVNVNLVGSIVENTVLTDRLTTYPILALTVDADARVDSSETTPVTASQFEQFVDVVRDEASAIQNYTYDSEAWAVGQRAGVDVPSTDETYQNNAKYYADQGATLQQEVTDLKSALNQGFMQGVLPLSEYNNPSLWELGGIGSDGQNANSSMQCRLIKSYAMYAQDDCVIKTSVSDFYLFVFQYGDSACTDYKGELGYIGGGTLSLALPKGYYYRFRSQTAPPVSVDSTVIATLATKFSVVENTLVSKHEEKISALETTATAHSASISDLEDKYYLEYGINRNPNNDVSGYLKADGSIGSSPAYYTTDYCYVGDLESVICSGNAVGGTSRYAQDMAFLCTYTEDKTFIEQVYTTESSTYTVGENVAFIRFCINHNVQENVMLQGGSDFAPSFIPYVAPQQKLKPQYYNSGSNWSDKKWVAVGDSITEYNSKADKHYHDYVNEATGINVVNMGSSGTGYKRTEDESKAFYQRILNAPTDADVVTIFGSGNDLNYSAMGFSTFAEALGSPTDSGTSTICGCINQTIANLYSIMPTVQLGIVTPNPWETMNPANVGNDMDLYSNAIIEICKLHGIPCLDLYHCSNMRPWDATYRTLCYSNDGGYGVHPNDLGHKILASHFKAFLDTLLI